MVITRFCRVVMHMFFSTVRVHHGERLPLSGPVLIVANHHSSLVDPVALLATMPRTPRFLAKSVLWSGKYIVLRPLLWLAKAIPVHRHVDGGGDNSDMFAVTRQALCDGDVIALFGEGLSHNMPGLLDLKTGAARMALATDAAVAVVPVGLIYDDRARYRSRAMIYVGEPIMVEGGAGGDQDRDRVRELTDQIAAELDEVAPSWETWDAHHAALMAARLSVADSPDLTLGESLTMLNRAIDGGTAEGRIVLAAVHDLEQESARLGLDIETVVDRPRHRVARLNWLSRLGTALYFVPTVLGRFLNLAPHLLVNRVAGTQALNFQATAKILIAILVYPLWWLVVAAATAVIVNPLWALISLAALPLLGYISSRTYGRLRRFKNRQVVRHQSRSDDHGGWQLVALRHAVLNATDAVLAAQWAAQGRTEG